MRKFKCIRSDKSKHKGDRKEYFVVGSIYNEGGKGGVLSESGHEFTNSEDIIQWLGGVCGYYLEEIFDEEIKEDKKVGKFKVGDMVKILDGSNIGEYTYGWASEMNGNVDKIAKILSIEEENGLPCYCLNDFDYVKNTGGCIYDERGLELVIAPKTFTITTSDTTTTLTDGTHTTTINRYYTDKHDEMVALEEVVKKYKSEIDEIELSKEKHLFDDETNYYYETNCDYGVIGTPTILTDSVGRKLFVGDVVKVYNKDGSDDGFIDLVCHDNEDGDFIMGYACATRNNSKKEYNYLKEMSYEDISNDNKIWDSCLVIK